MDAIAIAAATTTEARVSFIQFSRAKLHGGDALQIDWKCLIVYSLASKASCIYIFEFSCLKLIEAVFYCIFWNIIFTGLKIILCLLKSLQIFTTVFQKIVFDH